MTRSQRPVGPVGPTGPATAEQARSYQALRSQLATLKLTAAAEALPTVQDAAREQQWTLTAALEHLLAIEVDATEARCLAGRLRFACLPSPATLTGSVKVSWPRGVSVGWPHPRQEPGPNVEA